MEEFRISNGPACGGSIRYSGIVELSHPIHPAVPRWPGDPAVEFQPHSEIDRDGYFLRRFSMGEHSGTHLTAPASFYRDAATADAFAAEDLVRPTVVVDVREESRHNADYCLSASRLLAWEAGHGPVLPGSLVLLCTGWSSRWSVPVSYLGQDETGTLHFPGFGLDAARLLIDERGAAGLGIDTAGVDCGVDRNYSVSKLTLTEPHIVLENLTNLERLPPTGAVVVIGVLRLAGGSGAPVSATAFLP